MSDDTPDGGIEPTTILEIKIAQTKTRANSFACFLCFVVIQSLSRLSNILHNCMADKLSCYVIFD